MENSYKALWIPGVCVDEHIRKLKPGKDQPKEIFEILEKAWGEGFEYYNIERGPREDIWDGEMAFKVKDCSYYYELVFFKEFIPPHKWSGGYSPRY